MLQLNAHQPAVSVDADASLTSPASYIDYIVAKKGIDLPEIPQGCLISYSADLVARAQALHESQTIDIGSRKPVEITFFRPSRGRDFAMVTQQNGASMAVVLVEELIAMGFDRFISVGTAGHPSVACPPTMSIGDILLVTSAHVYEGTSAHYNHNATVAHADNAMYSLLRRRLIDAQIPFVEGTVATTDAIYRETPRFVREICALGAMGLDMETSALYTACAFHGKPIAAALYVSDVICPDTRWDLRPLEDAVGRAEMAVFETALHVMQHESL